MGLFSLGKKVETMLLETEEHVFRIENFIYFKNNIVLIEGRVLKGEVKLGDSFVFLDKEYEIPCIQVYGSNVLCADTGTKCSFVLPNKTTGSYRTIFKKGAVKILKTNPYVSQTPQKQENKPIFEHTRSIANETFVCDGCGEEFNIKYRYRANLCEKCATQTQARTFRSDIAPSAFEDVRSVCKFFPSSNQLLKMRKLSAKYKPAVNDPFSYMGQKIIRDRLLPIVSITIDDMVQEHEWKKVAELEGIAQEKARDKIMTELIETTERNIAAQKLKFAQKHIADANMETLLGAWYALDFYDHVFETGKHPYIIALRNYIHQEFILRYLGGQEELEEEKYLDDITVIDGFKHTLLGPWHQYDFLLNIQPYGWDAILDCADYVAQADIQVVVIEAGYINGECQNLSEAYVQSGKKCKKTPQLEQEKGKLTLFGQSTQLKESIEIDWVNQTRTL